MFGRTFDPSKFCLTRPSDTSSDLGEAKSIFAERHPSSHKPSTADMDVLRSLASFISIRSSAIVATCVYTLWDVRLESHREYVAELSKSSPLRQGAHADLELEKTMVAFNGSVIENYPGYLESCQRYVNELVGESKGGIELVLAKESSLIGAAVASACVKTHL